MSAKILSFEIPTTLVNSYPDPECIPDGLFEMEDLIESLGPIGGMIREHKYLMLNWLEYSDFMKPQNQWSGRTIRAISEQKESFNDLLGGLGDIPVTLIDGHTMVLKRARFVVRDITDERQELATILGIVSEVLFLEAVAYSPSDMMWYSIEDYQIREVILPECGVCPRND